MCQPAHPSLTQVSQLEAGFDEASLVISKQAWTVFVREH